LAREQRRLAAILAVDVVGYSRMMGRDESGTLARLKAHRTERLEPVLERHGGRMVKLTGDGALAEFPSAVNALGAAIAFQQAMTDANADQPTEIAIVFRVGIHLGDLIVDGDDLYGDGVNVAARLEAEAPAGGVVISGDVHNAVMGRLKVTFDDLGTLSLKNIERPIHAFAAKWDSADWQVFASARTEQATASALSSDPLALPDKPSIAVLPFQNMSGDPAQEYFVDGLVEDIITALSRFKSLFVIARNSSFTYKGKAVDVRQVGRELGVRYVLEGSVRKSGNRLRITAQLIEADTGGHVWSERYDAELQEVFDLQDRITSSVTGMIEPTLQEAEIARVIRRHDSKPGAYDCYLRALALTNAFTREAAEGMLKYSLQAIALDPLFAPPYALAARSYVQRTSQSWIVDLERERLEVLDLVERGLRADRRDAMILGTAGQCYAWFGRDLVKAVALIDEAIDINPNYAHAFLQSGIVRTRAGDFNKAVMHLEQGLRLSPRDARGYAFYQGMALALLLTGRTEAAREWAWRGVQHNANYSPSWYVLAGSAAALGNKAEAQRATARLLELDPTFSIRSYVQRYPTSGPEVLQPLVEGLRLAGVPERPRARRRGNRVGRQVRCGSGASF
jgi:TolB-like protein/class 3 adenylate cyclase/tetratricopeptide (TPR) repeat protein